jgi:hypothetical protein
MKTDEIAPIVLEVLAHILCRTPDPNWLDQDLTNDLHIDSDDLSYIFVPELVARFAVEIPRDEWGRVNTGQDACALLARYLEGGR